ncbi:MAG: RHS domain-containing protein [Beijerinckiaceae bacterium]
MKSQVQDFTFYIAPDHLGSAHEITDSTGAVVWQWRPHPFGNGAPTGSSAYDVRFPGQLARAAAQLPCRDACSIAAGASRRSARSHSL